MLDSIVEELVDERMTDFVKKMISKERYTAETISELTEIPLDEVKKLMEEHSA